MKKVLCFMFAMAFVLSGFAMAEEQEHVFVKKFPPSMNVPGPKPNKVPSQPKRNFPGMNKPSNQGRFMGENPHNRFHDIEGMKKNDPERFKLLQADAEMDRKIKELVRQYKVETNDEKKDALRKEITELCTKHFDVRQQRRELDLARMKAWLNQMEQGIEKSRHNKDKIIEQRINSLLDDNLGEF
ncbi:MAG: hypothetical protein IJF84_04255 [Thermoguttaceae bacterium]|nr:hypothetical protein [Thermoguttaceae bacterium]